MYAGKTNWLTVGLFAFAIILVFGATYGIIIMTERWTHSSARKLVYDVVVRINDKIQEVEEATRNEAGSLRGRFTVKKARSSERAFLVSSVLTGRTMPRTLRLKSRGDGIDCGDPVL